VDTVAVPDVPAGEWVLGWRYDTESTDQVWSNCADITIVV
jgi:lytic starch monooxygenase